MIRTCCAACRQRRHISRPTSSFSWTESLTRTLATQNNYFFQGTTQLHSWRQLGSTAYFSTDRPSRPSNGRNTVDRAASRAPRSQNTSRTTQTQSSFRNPSTSVSNHKKKTSKSVLSELVTTIGKIQDRLERLDQLPTVWQQQSSPPASMDGRLTRREFQQLRSRQQVFLEAQKVVRYLQSFTDDDKVLKPNKYSREISILLERLLEIFSKCGDLTQTKSLLNDKSFNKKSNAPTVMDPFGECCNVLDCLAAWNIDVNERHCNAVITAAARQGLWERAGRIFYALIDPDDSGYAPFDSCSVQNPMGLYVLVRAAQEQGSTSVVEPVLEAVLRMSMVSPSDQDKYILAAGAAIGYAGECKAFVRYLKTSYNASQLGQPLVASVMHACVLCGEHDQAIEVFDDLLKGDLAVIAEEWQWGGGQDRVDPRCRDLAMRALGGSRLSGSSDRALDFYREIKDERSPISVQALSGVMKACTRERGWEDAMSILFDAQDRKSSPLIIVAGDALELTTVTDDDSAWEKVSPHMGEFVSSVMKACNVKGEFGLALLALRLFETSLPESVVGSCHEKTRHAAGTLSFPEVPESIGGTAIACIDTDILATTAMVSLCGLSWPSAAADVFEVIDSLNEVKLVQARDVYGYAKIEETAQKERGIKLAWEAPFQNVHRITAAVHKVINSADGLSSQDTDLFASALATTVHSCTVAGQAQTGLCLVEWVERTLSGEVRESDTVLGSSVLPVTDGLLAAVIDAYLAVDRPDDSFRLFQNHVAESMYSEMTLSSTAAIKILFKLGRIEDAVSLFHKTAANNYNPDLFVVVARGLVQAKEWSVAADLYRLAVSVDCVNEDLSLLAMKAVASSHSDGKIRVLRNIVNDLCQRIGFDENIWRESNYWALKRLIGPTMTSRLMWWQDPKTRHLEELELALRQLDESSSSGLMPKKDVIRLIVSAAKSFRNYKVPPERTRLPRIPRDRETWLKTLRDVVQVAKHTSLMDEPHFIENVTHAFQGLGQTSDSVRVVSEAIARGLRMKESTLQDVSRAADETGTDLSIDDIRMLTNGIADTGNS